MLVTGREAGSATTERWRQLHDEALVWLIHDHFYHRLDANLAMAEGGVTAKTVVPIGDLAVYNDSDAGEDDLAFYERTLKQTEGWAKESLIRLERARLLYESRPDRFVIASNADDVFRAKAAGKAAIFLGCEGCKAFEGRLELLRAFHRLGVRQMQLIWARPNQLVDVSATGAWRLSGFGRDAVALMNELGVVIDLSHAPWTLFDDVTALSRQPVIVSHGAPNMVFPRSGDMSGAHLDALKACGGLLGLHFCRHYINGPFATFEDFLRVVDYLVGQGYEDTVALGGDLFEVDSYFRARHPPPGGATHETWSVFIEEIGDVRRIPAITRALVERGYPERTTRSILGENALRVYRSVMG